MGIIQHTAIVVTSYDYEEAERFYKTALEIFASKTGSDYGEPIEPIILLEKLVGPLMQSIANDYWTFVIGPDGSKVGWETHIVAEEARAALKTILLTDPSPPDWFEISYGEREINVDGVKTRIVSGRDVPNQSHKRSE